MKKYIYLVFIMILLLLNISCKEDVKEDITIDAFKFSQQNEIIIEKEEEKEISVYYNDEKIMITEIINQTNFLSLQDNVIKAIDFGKGNVIIKFIYNENEYEKTFNVVCYGKYDFEIINDSLYETEEQLVEIKYEDRIIEDFTLTSSDEEIIKVNNNSIIGIDYGLSAVITATFTYNEEDYKIEKEIAVKKLEKLESIEIICDGVLFHDEVYEIELKTTPEYATCLGTLKIGSYEIPVGKYDKKIKLEEPISFYLKSSDYDHYQITMNYESKDHRVKEETRVLVTKERLVFYMDTVKIHNCWVNLLIYRDLETNEFIISEYSEDNYAEIFYNYCDALGIVPLWKITNSYAIISKKNNGKYSLFYIPGIGKTMEFEIEVPEYEKDVESEGCYPKGELTNKARVKINIGVNGELLYNNKNIDINLNNAVLWGIGFYRDYYYNNLVFLSDSGYAYIESTNEEVELYSIYISVKFIDKPKYYGYSNYEINKILISSFEKVLAEIKVNEIIMELANEIFIYNNNE